MHTHLGHMQFNVHPDNLSFYKELLIALGWQPLYEDDGRVSVVDKNGVSLWFVGQVKDVTNDYDGPGLNHLAFSAASQADVNAATAYLAEHNVERLFETPRHRAEFSQSEDTTYYQVMFETPDRILVEVVYIGPKSG